MLNAYQRVGRSGPAFSIIPITKEIFMPIVFLIILIILILRFSSC